MSRSRVVRLTALDVTRIVILPADWGDKDYDERVEWLASWASGVITEIVDDAWGDDDD